MKKTNIVAAAAVATAGIATYLIRKKLRSGKKNNSDQPSPDNGHHLTKAFANAKSKPKATPKATPKAAPKAKAKPKAK